MSTPFRRLICQVLLLLAMTAPLAAQRAAAAHVVLVTLDGVRPAEFFSGMDSSPSADSTSGAARTWRGYSAITGARPPRPGAGPSCRFCGIRWPRGGVVFGDRDLGSRASITNVHGFSAPGDLEILTGRAQPDVTSNDPQRYPHATLLDVIRDRLARSPRDVATFASWQNFRYYVSSREGAVFVNAGFDTLPTAMVTPSLAPLQRLERRALPPRDESRLDAFTGAMGLAYLRQYSPIALYFAMNDTDDQAHGRRYDRVLDALHGLDGFLLEQWQTVQSLPGYRGRTTLLITTDHGRGLGPRDWSDHGEDTRGSDQIWILVVGLGVPARGIVTGGPEVHQAQVAATLLACLGLGTDRLAEAEAPLPGVCGN